MGYSDRIARLETRYCALADKVSETRKEFHRLQNEFLLCRGAVANLQSVINFLEEVRRADQQAQSSGGKDGATDEDDYDGIPDEPASEFLDWGDDDPVPEVWGDES